MQAVSLSKESEENVFAVLLHAMLTDCAERHGGQLPGLVGSRLGLLARDAGAEATLLLGSTGTCVIIGGLVEADLVIEADSDLLPRLQSLPLRFGMPWLLSTAGGELLLAMLQQRPRVRGLLGLVYAPARTLRALWDAHRLAHLLAGGP